MIALLLTVAPISIAGLYSLTHSQASLEKMIGAHFQTIAEHSSAEISQFIHDRVTSVGVLAFDPVVQEAAKNANAAYQGMSDPAVAARIEQTLDYYQADEEFWQAIYAQGRGSVNLTDILYDDVTKSHYIGVGVPIVEEGSNRFIGAVDALLEVSAVFPIVNRAQIGAGFRSLLVKEDGTVISAPHVNLAMKIKSDEHSAMLEAFASSGAHPSGYLVSDLKSGGATLIGFADTGLKKDYGNLGWTVLVAQEASEAFAPIRMVSRMLSFMALIGLATVVFLAVYFSLHRKPAYTDMDELAHPARAASA